MALANEKLCELPARTRDVLLAVLDEYIDSGAPVASRSVARRSRLGISAATVRGTMAGLTELGLLCQPHTSAGRIPTHRAFRLYVDSLLGEALPAQPTMAAIQRDLSETTGTPEEFVRRAADLLTRETGQLGFFVGIPADGLTLQRVYFLRVSSQNVMALLVSRSGTVQTRVFEEHETDRRTLERVSERLSEFVDGFTLAAARARLSAEVEGERRRSDALWRRALSLGATVLAAASEVQLYLGDRSYLLTQPEFGDMERLRELLAALDEKQRMLRLLDRLLYDAGPSVGIGAEMDDPGVRACAVVTAPLGGSSPPVGGIGVIGPVRMRYDRVIPAVRQLSKQVSAHID